MTDTTVKSVATVFPITSESLKTDSKFRRRRSIIREFSLTTSTHGIPGIARSENIHNRIYWSISTIAFTGIMLYFVTESIANYFSYPTQTSVTFIVEGSQNFPAVTICNYSPLRMDTFMGPFINFTNSLNLTNTNDTSTITSEQIGYIGTFSLNLINRNEPIHMYFYPIESMLIYCSYNGLTCSSNDFIPFMSSSFGACYTFNAKMKTNHTKIRSTADNGGYGKLELKLYAHSQQYIPSLASDVSAGMVTIIHHNTELPLIDTGNVQLAGGRKHKLNYKIRRHHLLPYPYSQCTDTIPLSMKAMYDQFGGADYAYSQTVCYNLCVQTYIYTQCGCVSPEQWTARSVVLPGTDKIIEAPLCNGSDSCYRKAAVRIVTTASIWDQFCSHCAQACENVEFTLTPSSAASPSSQFLAFIKSFVENSNITLSKNWSTTWESEIQQNYVSLDVVCQTYLVENFTQEASVSPVDLLSNVGGHTGLWIGISFLSIMELIEMLYRLVRFHVHVLKRKLQRKYNRSQS